MQCWTIRKGLTFQLMKEEYELLKSQHVTSSSGGHRTPKAASRCHESIWAFCANNGRFGFNIIYIVEESGRFKIIIVGQEWAD